MHKYFRIRDKERNLFKMQPVEESHHSLNRAEHFCGKNYTEEAFLVVMRAQEHSDTEEAADPPSSGLREWMPVGCALHGAKLLCSLLGQSGQL